MLTWLVDGIVPLFSRNQPIPPQNIFFSPTPTSHNWYKTAATLGWSVRWEPVCPELRQTDQPTNQLGEEAKTASSVRLGHQGGEE